MYQVVTTRMDAVTQARAAKRMAYLRARNVRNYLRDLGYDGKAPVKRTIVRRPAAGESVEPTGDAAP